MIETSESRRTEETKEMKDSAAAKKTLPNTILTILDLGIITGRLLNQIMFILVNDEKISMSSELIPRVDIERRRVGVAGRPLNLFQLGRDE